MLAAHLSDRSNSSVQDVFKKKDIYTQVYKIVTSLFTGEHCRELREYIESVDIEGAYEKKWDGVLFDSIKRIVEEYNKKDGKFSTYEGEELAKEAYNFVTSRLKQGKFEVTEERKKLCNDIIEWGTNFKKDNQHIKNNLFLKARETHSGDELLQLVRKMGLIAFTANELMPSEGFENMHGYLEGIITNYNQRRREYDESSSDVEKATKFEDENNIYYTIFTVRALDSLFRQAAQDPDTIKELCENEIIIKFYNDLKSRHDVNKREEDQERYRKILSDIIKDNDIQPYAIVTEYSNLWTPGQDCLTIAIELEKELMSKDNITNNKERTYYIIANRSANHWITIQIKLSAKNEENEREIDILMVDPAGGKEEIKEYKSTEKVPNNPGYPKLPSLPREYKLNSTKFVITNQQRNDQKISGKHVLSTCGIRAVFNIGFITGIFGQPILPKNLGIISPQENEIRRVANKIVNNKDNSEANLTIKTWATQAILNPKEVEGKVNDQITKNLEVTSKPYLYTTSQFGSNHPNLINRWENIKQDTKRLEERITLLERSKQKIGEIGGTITKSSEELPLIQEGQNKKLLLNKDITFINKLFEREFERIINNYGENSSQHCKDILKKLLKINTVKYNDTSASLNIEKFYNHLLKSKVFINFLLIKNIRNASINEKNEIKLCIFLALGLSAKLVNNLGDPYINELKNIFLKFYDLIKLSTRIQKNGENESLDQDMQDNNSEIDQLLEEIEDYSQPFTHNPGYATNAHGATPMPTYRVSDLDTRYIEQHLKQVLNIINQLINIFSQEFICITSKIQEDKSCLQDIKDMKLKCFVDWYLDCFYLGKLYDILRAVPDLDNEKFRARKQEFYAVLYQTFSLGNQIFNTKLSDRMKGALQKTNLYLVFSQAGGNSPFDEFILTSGMFEEIKEKINYVYSSEAFDSKIMIHNLSHLKRELASNLEKLQVQEMSGGIGKLREIIEITKKFSSTTLGSTKLAVDTIKLYYHLIQFHKSNKPEITDKLETLKFLQTLRTKIEHIYKNLPDNFGTTSELTLYLEFYIVCFYNVAEKLIIDLQHELSEEEIKSHLKTIQATIQFILESEYLILYNYEKLVDKIMTVYNSIDFIFGEKVTQSSLNEISEIDNLYHIQLEKDYYPFKKGFEWAIPNLAVLIGKNGSGKTRLLNYIADSYSTQLNIDANHLQYIEESFSFASNDISSFENMTTEEVCFHISESGAFPRPNMFPIIAFLYVEHSYPRKNSVEIEMAQALGITKIPVSIKERLNSLLKQYKLKFELAKCSLEEKQFHIYFKKQGELIEFLDLSSGEKVMFTLLSCALSNELVYEHLGFDLTKVLLFDEIDIHFHPKYTSKFFKIINDHFSHNTYVVITTHNPATIALAEQLNKGDSRKKLGFYTLNESSQKTEIVQADTARQAISKLSQGLMNIVQDKNVVFTESEDDTKVYTALKEKLEAAKFLTTSNTELVFIPIGGKRKIDKGFEKRISSLENDILKIRKNIPENEFELIQNKIKALKEYNDNPGEKEGGKDKVRLRVYHCGTDNVHGLLDADYGNVPSDKTHVLPLEIYSIENLLCCPINLFLTLKRFKKITYYDEICKEVLTYDESFIGELKEAKQGLLQLIINKITDKVKQNIGRIQELKITKLVDLILKMSSETLEIKNLQGDTLYYPKWLFNIRGHDLLKIMSVGLLQEGYYEKEKQKLLQDIKNSGGLYIIKNTDLLQTFKSDSYTVGFVLEELCQLINRLKNSYNPAPGITHKEATAQSHIGQKHKKTEKADDTKIKEHIEKGFRDFNKKDENTIINFLVYHNIEHVRNFCIKKFNINKAQFNAKGNKVILTLNTKNIDLFYSEFPNIAQTIRKNSQGDSKDYTEQLKQSNAFNRYWDMQYKYQLKDMRLIGAQLINNINLTEEKIKFIGVIGGSSKDQKKMTRRSILSYLKEMQSMTPGIGIFYVEEQWIVFCIVPQVKDDDKVVTILYKDILAVEQNTLYNTINDIFNDWQKQSQTKWVIDIKQIQNGLRAQEINGGLTTLKDLEIMGRAIVEDQYQFCKNYETQCFYNLDSKQSNKIIEQLKREFAVYYAQRQMLELKANKKEIQIQKYLNLTKLPDKKLADKVKSIAEVNIYSQEELKVWFGGHQEIQKLLTETRHNQSEMESIVERLIKNDNVFLTSFGGDDNGKKQKLKEQVLELIGEAKIINISRILYQAMRTENPLFTNQGINKFIPYILSFMPEAGNLSLTSIDNIWNKISEKKFTKAEEIKKSLHHSSLSQDLHI